MESLAGRPYRGNVSIELNGVVAVVTGATAGLGREIARGLAGRGARVVINTRDAARGEAAKAYIGPEAVTVLPMDVSDQASVRSFAAAVRDLHDRVDILVNNAGAWFTERRVSADGLELTFATNVLGPYLLTELLLDPLRAAPAGRVVNVVSSIAGDYDPTDLQFTKRPYDGFKSYAQSKYALRLLTWSFAGELAGTPVTVNAAAPGFVRTEFNRNATGGKAVMINLSARLFGSSPAKGADTPLWVAIDPSLKGRTGAYFAKRTAKDRGDADPAAIEDLRDRCADLTSLQRS
jgi:NAD(P)-dependent dehydrogenase (short-subunit alcohol dehydrogenase family)